MCVRVCVRASVRRQKKSASERSVEKDGREGAGEEKGSVSVCMCA